MKQELPDPFDSTASEPHRPKWGECLGLWSKIAALLYLALAILVSLPQLIPAISGEASPVESGEAFGSLTGAVVVTFLIACLFSWIAYMMSRRGRFATSATFIIILGFFALGQLGSLAERGSNRESMRDFGQIAERQREANIELLQRSLRGEDISEASDQLKHYVGELDRISGDLRGDEAAMMRAAATVLRTLEGPNQDYHEVFNAFDAAGGVDAATLRDRESCQSRLVLIDEFERANEALATAIDQLEPKMRAELKREGITGAAARQFMTGWSRSSNVSTLRDIRATDRQLAQAFRGMVQHLHDHMYQWTIDEQGELVFRDDAAAEAYDVFWNEMNDTADEQERLQQKLIRLMQTTGRP
ncbi:MAG: hypothetical protein AAF593_15970 [Planctomycetota bacterium]